MYHAHFGLDQPPFRITPDPAMFFPGGRRGAVLDALAYAITHGEGIVKVVGEVGSGKTMLCRTLETRLPESVEILYLANPSLSPENILHAIAMEMRLPVTTQTDRLEVMNTLHAALLERHAAGRHPVVFVEEAQGMPMRTLEELRLLSNLETHRSKLLQIVLFGQPELDDHLGSREVRQLNDRITHSFHLEPFRQDEVGDYIEFRLRTAGYRGAPLFTPDAVRIVARAARGLVRRVNVLCDKAMLAAYAEGSHRVEQRHARAAVRDSALPGSRAWRPWAAAAGGMAVAAVLAVAAYQQLQASGAAPAAAVPEAAPAAPIAPAAPQAPATQLEERLAATRDWLAHAPDSRYAIQLMTTRPGGAGVEEFLALADRHALLDRMFVYRGQSSLGLVLADYPSYSAAAAALGELPPQLAIHKPFIRSVRSVRREQMVPMNSADSPS